jgi:putative spermidine/putrescine transport system permease protein
MATAAARPGWRRRVSAFLYRHPRVRLGVVLGPPMGWMLVVYLGALLLLFVTAFWTQNVLTSEVQRSWNLENFKTILTNAAYRTIALRTVGLSLAAALTDIVLALPIAYYAARIARPTTRLVLLLSITLPLWSSYLARVYAWRIILSGTGLVNWSLDAVGVGAIDVAFSNWSVWIVFTYLWLPFVTLPIYASLERIPNSLIEASADLGARWWLTFRRVILPIALPGIVAGSLFAFALTLGDYIVPSLVGNTLFIGNVIYQSVGVANNIPFAAAYALVPAGIMAIYLLGARRLGAFEAL